MKNTEEPELSVIVVAVGDTLSARSNARAVSQTLAALIEQRDAPPTEIIVPFHAGIEGVAELAADYPQVLFLKVNDAEIRPASREHHDELRARAAGAARGKILAFLEDHVSPRPDWASEIVRAHRAHPAAAVIGGAIENQIDRALNWANFFCDLGKYQNPLPDGDSTCASLVNASYKRAALDAIETVWRERFNETTINQTLLARGEKITLSPKILVSQRRENLRLKPTLGEFFVWGRSFAGTRSRQAGAAKRIFYALLSPLLPIVLIARLTARVVRRGAHVAEYVRALPFVVLLTASWSLGEAVGYFASLPEIRNSPHPLAPVAENAAGKDVSRREESQCLRT